MDRAQRVFVRQWWRDLSVRDRESLRIERPRLLARFVEVDPNDEDVDLYEWIVAHEFTFFPSRTFHICIRHVFLRLEPLFTCPFAESRCPMRAILDASPNRKIRFV